MPKVADDAAPEPITIVLADDHAVVRDGLRMVLEAQPDLEVVAEAGDAEAAGATCAATSPTSSSSTSTCRAAPSLS